MAHPGAAGGRIIRQVTGVRQVTGIRQVTGVREMASVREAGPGAGEGRGVPGQAARLDRVERHSRAVLPEQPAEPAVGGLGQVSARGADKIIRVAWSLADLASADRPGPEQVNLAIGLWLGVPQ